MRLGKSTETPTRRLMYVDTMLIAPCDGLIMRARFSPFVQ
jgi:hypothetical protein